MENKDVLNGVGLPGMAASPILGKQEITLPTKRSKSKMWKIFAGLAAILLVAGVAFGSYYFTANLNQASTPNAPDSEPFAKEKEDGGGRVKSARDIGNPAKRNEALKKEEEVKKAKAAAAKSKEALLAEAKKAIDAGKQVPGGVNYTADMMATLNDYAKKKYGTSYPTAPGVGRTGDVCTGAQCSNDDGLVKDQNGKTITNYSGFYAVNTYGADGKVTGVAYRPIAAPLKEKDSGGGGKTTASCKVTTWTPATNTVCADTEFTQTSNCKTTRKATGTKDCSCTVTSWTPATNTVCKDEDFTQTSNCDTTREAVGTKVCETGTPDLSATKMAYKNESSNSSGRYTLSTEVDKVSRDQVFVYAFEITNNGDGKANKVTLKDVLRGDNQEWLSYVDGESRCKYSASTRTVTCSGMTLEAGENDTYKFRVRVSSSATNGEIIKNVGVISYENMPNGGEAEASLELTVSSVVGCNKTCTSDEECSTGLTCDPDSNTCRRPACADASSCVCVTERVVVEEEPTPEPTERVIVVTQAPRRVVVKAAPTVLPETGILDFPGAAAFGGGLVLAVIGILLAL